MSNKCLALIFSAALAAGTAFAQDKSKDSTATTETKKTTGTGHTTNAKTETVVGEVKKYEPGKSIEVSGGGKLKKTRTFDLEDKNMTATVDPSVTVGSRVKVTQKIDDSGHKTLTVEPAGKSEHASKRHKTEKQP